MPTTVQTVLAKLAQRVDPRTRQTQQVFQDNSGASTITNATNATPIVVTSANHGILTGQQCYIAGVLGNTAANNTPSNPSWTVTVTDANTFSLNGSIGNGAYTSGGTVVAALIGSVDGKRFTRQRLLDIYNDARIVIAQVALRLYGKQKAGIELSGVVQQSTNITFAGGVASRPPGYVSGILLTDVNLVPIAILSAFDILYVQGYESLTNRFVLDTVNTFKTISGNTFVPDASNYVLWYYGINAWVLSDVLNGTTVETINDDALYVLLEISEGIAQELGTVELNALAVRALAITPQTPLTVS
jgi:hypothetical protein